MPWLPNATRISMSGRWFSALRQIAPWTAAPIPLRPQGPGPSPHAPRHAPQRGPDHWSQVATLRTTGARCTRFRAGADSGAQVALNVEVRRRALHVRFERWVSLRCATVSPARSHRPACSRRSVDPGESAASLPRAQSLARAPLFRRRSRAAARSPEIFAPSSEHGSLPRIIDGFVEGTKGQQRAPSSTQPPAGLALLPVRAQRRTPRAAARANQCSRPLG